jgi:hypothetical protein
MWIRVIDLVGKGYGCSAGFCQALDHFCFGNPLVPADQACPNAMANETTIMQAKAKFRFMKFPSKTCVMPPS